MRKDNIYFDTRGAYFRFTGQSFAEWQAAGNDADSVIADYLFVNAGNFDFRLKPDSPALKMGFQQIDLKAVGPRTPVGL